MLINQPNVNDLMTRLISAQTRLARSQGCKILLQDLRNASAVKSCVLISEIFAFFPTHFFSQSSTRRFFFLPSSVELEETGINEPNPVTSAGEIPRRLNCSAT